MLQKRRTYGLNGEFVIALHAEVFLRHKGGWLTSEEIAGNVCTNAVCVRRVMAKLVKAGLAEKKEGRSGGGYRFAEKRVTLLDIANAVGAEFADLRYRSGSVDKPCMIASGMTGYVDGLCAELDALCRERLANVTVADVEAELARRHGALSCREAEQNNGR